MAVVDIHSHIAPRRGLMRIGHELSARAPRVETTDTGYVLVVPGGRKLGPFPAGLLDPDIRLDDMDRQGVDIQALSIPPTLFAYDLPSEEGSRWAQILNDAMIELAREHPDRFRVLVTLPLQDPLAAIQELERVLVEEPVGGIEIGTHVGGVDLDDERFEPIWRLAAGAKLGILLHPDQGDALGKTRLNRYYLVNLVGNPVETTLAVASLVFGGVLERHPELKIGCVHGGGYAPYQVGRWDHGWSCRPETSARLSSRPSESFSRIFFDSLTHDALSLTLLGDLVGWSQVMVGSDYPFDMGVSNPLDSVKELELDAADERMILGGTASRFLRS